MIDIILWILRIIGWYICFLTGELLLFIISFGRHSFSVALEKAKAERKYAKGMLYFEISLYIGMIFWLAVIVLVREYIL
jgi:hypothetical protein